MHSIGIDIGTSNISGVIINQSNEMIDCISKSNNSDIHAKAFESLQDPNKILQIIIAIIDELLAHNPALAIKGIAFSNQMHGFLYVDNAGNAVSPFFNWQDKRGDEIYGNDTYFGYVEKNTDYKVPVGYGLLTHFFNVTHNLVPDSANMMLDIGSFVIGKMIHKKINMIHPSNAQAWGFFNDDTQDFDKEALFQLGINSDMLPYVKEEWEAWGKYKNISIFFSLGDNQAGFLGAVGQQKDSMLINIGTSAQLSLLCDDNLDGIEKRPFMKDTQLWTAASLSGGKTIDLWVSCIADVCIKIMLDVTHEDMKKKIYALMSDISDAETSIKVIPHFYGSRDNVNALASIEGLSFHNFNFEALSLAMIQGVIDELYDFWKCLPEHVKRNKKNICVTGGGTRIPMLVSCIKKTFKTMNVYASTSGEEAAIGAAKLVMIMLKHSQSIRRISIFSKRVDSHHKGIPPRDVAFII